MTTRAPQLSSKDSKDCENVQQTVWRTRNGEIAALYLELASICFNEAATLRDADTAEALRRMSQRYLVEAATLNRALADQQLDFS